MIKIEFKFLLFALLAIILKVNTAIAGELSPTAQEGEKLFGTCLACHDASKEPAIGPPMFGVKNWYKKEHRSKEAFVEAIVKWVKEPAEERVVMTEPLQKFGLMPSMPLPDNMLSKIATYMYETQFEPPCTHWKNVIEQAKKTGTTGKQHVKQEIRNYDRLCK